MRAALRIQSQGKSAKKHSDTALCSTLLTCSAGHSSAAALQSRRGLDRAKKGAKPSSPWFRLAAPPSDRDSSLQRRFRVRFGRDAIGYLWQEPTKIFFVGFRSAFSIAAITCIPNSKERALTLKSCRTSVEQCERCRGVPGCCLMHVESGFGGLQLLVRAWLLASEKGHIPRSAALLRIQSGAITSAKKHSDTTLCSTPNVGRQFRGSRRPPSACAVGGCRTHLLV